MFMLTQPFRRCHHARKGVSHTLLVFLRTSGFRYVYVPICHTQKNKYCATNMEDSFPYRTLLIISMEVKPLAQNKRWGAIRQGDAIPSHGSMRHSGQFFSSPHFTSCFLPGTHLLLGAPKEGKVSGRSSAFTRNSIQVRVCVEKRRAQAFRKASEAFDFAFV